MRRALLFVTHDDRRSDAQTCVCEPSCVRQWTAHGPQTPSQASGLAVASGGGGSGKQRAAVIVRGLDTCATCIVAA